MALLNINVDDIVKSLEQEFPKLEITVETQDEYNKITATNESGGYMYFYPQLVNKAQEDYKFNMFNNEEEYINYLKEELKQFFNTTGYTY